VDELAQLVELTEREASLVELEARDFVAVQTAQLEAQLEGAHAQLVASTQRLGLVEREVLEASRLEVTSRARSELAAHSVRLQRAPVPGLPLTLGAAVCWFALGASFVLGGGCVTAPIALLAGRIGANDD
jgi:hypothetical protein